MKIQDLLAPQKEQPIEEILAVHDNQYYRLIGAVNANRFTYDFDDRDFDSGFSNQNTVDAIHEQNPSMSKEEIIALIKHLNTLNGNDGRAKTVQMVNAVEYNVTSISVQR